MAPLNGTAPEMQALGKYFREQGLYTFVFLSTLFNPPLCITAEEMREAFGTTRRGQAFDSSILQSRNSGGDCPLKPESKNRRPDPGL